MGRLWPHPWMLPGFLESLFREQAAWAAWKWFVGFARWGFSPPSTRSRGSLGSWGARGRWGRTAGVGSAPTAPLNRTFSFTWHKHSLMGWRQTGNHCSCPSFWMGNIPCFLGKDANPSSRDSGLWENGDRGVLGACAGCGGRGEESPFCLWTTLHRKRNCSRIRVKMREEWALGVKPRVCFLQKIVHGTGDTP